MNRLNQREVQSGIVPYKAKLVDSEFQEVLSGIDLLKERVSEALLDTRILDTLDFSLIGFEKFEIDGSVYLSCGPEGIEDFEGIEAELKAQETLSRLKNRPNNVLDCLWLTEEEGGGDCLANEGTNAPVSPRRVALPSGEILDVTFLSTDLSTPDLMDDI